MDIRIMSKESTNRVYHRPECRYAQKIKKRNRWRMCWDDAEWKGYRPCKCCNKIEFLYNMEMNNVEAISQHHDINVDLVDDEIIVRTDAGCWKILYKSKRQKFALYHRNYVNGRISLDEVEHAPYHRQRDMMESGSIVKYLNYIQKHDDFKLNMPSDINQMPRKTRKQRAYYRSAKKRIEKRKARRIDNLFLMIERNEGIKKLSFC